MENSASTADEYDFLSHEETAVSPEALAQIREWLQPTQYLAESGEYCRHLSSRAPSTGLWICETDEYQRWHDSADHGSLWIKGVPGAGKSVMAATIIQHLRTTEDCPVLFFFFRNIVASNFAPRALLRDWLAQLLPYSPKLQFALQSRLDTSLDETADNDLFQLFLDGVSCVPRVYCVGDALDEMAADNRPFLDRLNHIATFRPSSLKLLITSRPKQYLQSALRDSSILHISLQRRLIDVDILSYLHHRFDEAPIPDNGRQVKQQVVEMIARRSEGLFLHAKLAMDQVEPVLMADNPIDIGALEASLPVGLEEMYIDLLAKHRDESGVGTDIQVLVLEAVTHASRPLRLSELANLMRRICPDIRIPVSFKELISSCCGPLVEILEDETLQVIHHSFTEFLCGVSRGITTTGASSPFPVINSDVAHKRLAINSLRYLQSGSLLLQDETSDSLSALGSPFAHQKKPDHQVDYDEKRDRFEYREARLLHPFLSYAVENWSYHASRVVVEDEDLFAAVACFFNPDSIAFRRWLVLQWGSTSTSKESTEVLPTALHIAAFAGLSRLVLRLLQQGLSVSAVDAQNRVPLHWAAANGHAEVASLLIRHGGDPNAEDGRGLKPIHLAAMNNHASVVKILLESGVEPNTIKTRENHAGFLLGGERITKGECAILYASQAGHTETIMAMLPFCKNKILEQLLCECCRFGRAEAVLAILQGSDVSPDATYCGATALFLSSHAANARCVSALISKGADVGKKSTWEPRQNINGGGRPYYMNIPKAPLHHLIEVWGKNNDAECQTIFQMLIDAGADTGQFDGLGDTALDVLVTCKRGASRVPIHVPAMRALLGAGADPKKKESSGDTILHRVLQHSHSLEAVRLLIEHGSDINQRGSQGKTALHLTLGEARQPEITEAIVTYLLENGADPNIANDSGVTAVPGGMSLGPAVFRTLLSRCDGDSVKSQCWFRLAEERNMERFVQYLEILLAEGVDIETRRSDGRTLYLCCLYSETQLDVLRKHGANANVADSHGNNALHILCDDQGCTRSLLEKRIADGADPLAVNNNGDTLLHRVSCWYDGRPNAAKLVGWLASLGIPVNAVNNQGLSALHRSLKAVPRFFTSMTRTTGPVHFVNAINGGEQVEFELRNKDGMAPLHTAAVSSESTLATLIAAGADPNFLTADSQHVLHLACRARRSSIVGQILDRLGSAHVNQSDRFGRTPLHYACSAADAESVALLLKHGADVRAVDLRGCTPLHACAQSGLEQGVWDVGGGWNPWSREAASDPIRTYPTGHVQLYRRNDPERWSPSQSEDEIPQVEWGFFPATGTIVPMLLDAGCDVAAVENNQYHTALDVALGLNCTEFIDVFANDEELFLQATTRNLKRDQRSVERSKQNRQHMKAQIKLLQSRAALDALAEDESVYSQVRTNPCRYLDILTWVGAAELINDAFEANPLAVSNRTVLKALMHFGYLRVIERIPRLISHYGTYTSLRDWVRTAQATGVLPGDSSTFTPLQLACQRPECNMLILQHLVEKLHVDINERYAVVERDVYNRTTEIRPGGTALHLLALANTHWQLEAMRYLLARGANINALDAQGRSPLHIAACGPRFTDLQVIGYWRATAVGILLDHGANPDVIDKKGQSPLHKASVAPEITRELLRRGADAAAGTESPLFQAIRDQRLSTLEIFLDHGISVDSINEQSHSQSVHYSLSEPRKVYALLCTAFSRSNVGNSVPLLRALVERGADLYVPLNDDETLVHFLFQFPEYEVLMALLQTPCASRIDFNHRDQHGRTVLMAACDWREVLPRGEALGPPLRILDLGADATLVDKDGKTALHHLLENPGFPDDVLLQFINHKEAAATLFSKDSSGYSPLHYALRLLRPKVCQLLLAKGAQLLEPDPNGLTALHYIATQWQGNSRSSLASGYRNIELPKDYFNDCLALWQKFLAEGGSINEADSAGNTPLHAFLLSDVKMYSGYSGPPENSGVCHVAHYVKLFPPDSGVDIFAVNHAGETALHLISKRQAMVYSCREDKVHDKTLFQAMMSKGLDPLKEDAKERSALDVATACGNDGIVELLRRK